MEETKKISIIGTTTRYNMKKAMKIEKQIIAKKSSIKFKEDDFIYERQSENLLSTGLCKDAESEIKKKISGYKQQDIKKNVYEPENFITYEYCLEQLRQCELRCLYCKEEILFVYKNVRAPRQWSVDRIDNEKGHIIGNIVIACLECNLKRRCRTKEKYLFTASLSIKREGIDY